MKKKLLSVFSMVSYLTVVLLLFNFCSSGTGSIKDPDRSEYLFGKSIGYPLRIIEKVFPAEKANGYFTFFHGIKDVSVKDGILSFTLSKDSAILGWGNYLGKQKAKDVQDTFQEMGDVVLKIQQSSPSSKWDIHFYRDGSRRPLSTEKVSVMYEGSDWQELAFTSSDSTSNGIEVMEAKFDAMSFNITGEPGTIFHIEWMKLVQPLYAGYCRKEFELPEGKIWQAVANVGSKNYRNWSYQVEDDPVTEPYQEIWSTLYINGKKVEREGATDLFFTAPVDITPYLKPGKNCVGFYGKGITEAPFLYFQTRVVMESGEVIELASGPDWKYSPEEQEGWNNAGFDDSSWEQEVKEGKGPWVHPVDVSGSFGIPAYSGRLEIKNPGRKDLFYNADDSLLLDIYVPDGLKGKAPELSYYFGKSDSKGVSSFVSKGVVSEFEEDSTSLVYHVKLEPQQDGVYTIALRLKDSNGKVIEERPREPLVVLKKIDFKEILGNSGTEGLDLELEDVIDFTDLNDPHPTEQRPDSLAPPTIIHDGDLVYREVTDSLRGAGFSYYFEFKHPGSFYYLEVEYPDNKQRIIEVLIKTLANGESRFSGQCGVGAETGGRYLPTGKMQTLSWIHVADPGPHRLDIASSMDRERAAARSLKIYRIKGNLPALAVGTTRRYGIHTERDFYDSGIGKNFGTISIDKKSGKVRLRGRLAEPDLNETRQEQFQRAFDQLAEGTLMQAAVENLYWLKETGERYVQYLKYTGQNSHVMGCYMYSDYTSPNVFAPTIEDSRILVCPRTMFANLFDVNDIDFYAGVEFSQSDDVKTYANDAQVAQGDESAYMVFADGRQMYGFFTSYLQNWLYPPTQEKYCSLMERLGRTYGHLSRFKGVHNFNGIDTRSGGYWMPSMGQRSRYDDPLRISFDDITFKLFEAETGIRTGVSFSDPKRFEKRARYLKGNSWARGKFFSWRCDKFKELVTDAVTSLRKTTGRDVDMLNILQLPDYMFYQYMYYYNKEPFTNLSRKLGYDISKMNSIDGVWTGRWNIGWRHWYPRPPHRNPYTWMSRTDPRIISAFDRNTKRFVFIRTSWDENVYNGSNIRTLPQPSGYNCREVFVQAIITGDPELIVGGYTDININVGHEQMLREVLQPFTMLPKEKFSDVLSTGLSTNVAIRQLRQSDKSCFYIANPSQWGVSGSITISTPGEVFDIVSDSFVPVEEGELKFALKPFGLLAYRVTSPDLTIKGYKMDPLSEEEFAMLAKAVREFEDNVIAGNGLEPDDKVFLKPFVRNINTAMEEEEYAKAWSLLTEPRVWSLKTKMEKLN